MIIINSIMSNFLAVGVDITNTNDIINIMKRQVNLYTNLLDLDRNSNYYLERLAEAFEHSEQYNSLQHTFVNYITQLSMSILNNLPFCPDIIKIIKNYIKLSNNFIISNFINYKGELISPNLPLRRQTQYPYNVLPENDSISSLFIGIRVQLEDRSPACRYNSVNFYLNTDEIQFYTNLVKLLLKSLDLDPKKYIDKVLIRPVNK